MGGWGVSYPNFFGFLYIYKAPLRQTKSVLVGIISTLSLNIEVA